MHNTTSKLRKTLYVTLLAAVILGMVGVGGQGPAPAPTPAPAPVAPIQAAATVAEAAPIARVPPFRNSTTKRSDHVWRTWELIGGVGVNVVFVNTQPANVRFLTGFAAEADPARGFFPREDFYRTVKRYKPRVAINGTYFHLLNGQPTGAIVRHGRFLYDGRWGTTICIDRKGHVSFRYQSGVLGHNRGWDGVENAITTGPTLVRDGRLYMHARKEGFKDPAVLGCARRSALGLTWDNRLVLVTVETPISLNRLGNIMLRLNCKAAANLDGGSSTALYCNGEFVSKPHRRLSNVLLVYD